MSGPARVLLVEGNEDGTAGGSHQCLFDIARSLDPEQFTPIVLFYQNNRFAERLREVGVRTLIWEDERVRERSPVGGMRRAKQAITLIGAVGRRIRLLRSERIALLYLNNGPGIGFDDWLPAAKLLGIPALAHARGAFAMPRRAWHPLVRGFDAVAAISQEIEQFLLARGIPANRIVQIYDGVDGDAVRARANGSAADVRRELGVGPDGILIAMVGHLRPWKGQDLALEAIGTLAPAVRERLTIVFAGGVGHGDEAYAAGLHETVTRLGLEATVAFLGERSDTPAIMAASDIVLHASTRPEPFGLVVVEGMALGRAVVAAGIGGPTEIVTAGSGLLFDPTRPDMLAAALESLATDPAKRRQLGEGGRRRAEDFSLQRNVESLQGLYRSLLTRTPLRSPSPRRFLESPLQEEGGSMEKTIRIKPLRIGLWLESDGPGGAEFVVFRMAEELRQRGHHVIPMGPAKGVGWLGAKFRDAGFAPKEFTLRRPVDWACIRDLVRQIRQDRLDVVHSHEFTMAVYGAAAGRLVGCPHVTTMHGNQTMTAALRRRVALRWAFRTSAATIAVSAETRRHLDSTLGLSPGMVQVILNGVPERPGDPKPIRQELGVAPDELLLVAVGNLDSRKGHIVLLQALQQLRSAGLENRWRVAIAGGRGGDQREILEGFAREHGFQDRLHILTHREDIPNLLAAADVFAMPSLWEGLPLALLEAMLAGKAIVASRISGIPEAMTDEVEGLLCPPGDPASLAAPLGRLLSDPALRARLGAAALTRARREFTVGAMVDAYEARYRTALQRFARSDAVRQ